MTVRSPARELACGSTAVRDPTHVDHIERWAAYMRAHPTEWKRIHTAFIDAQFAKHREVLERLRKLPDGRERIIALYRIGNVAGYPRLLAPHRRTKKSSKS